MQVIDKIDKYIIEQLAINGRISFANIAKEINLTDVAIKKRLDRLMQRGIIKSISAEIDYEILGFNEKIEILISIDPAKQNDILKKLKDMEDVKEVVEVTGEYNVLARVMALDKSDLKTLLDNIFKVDGITKISILTILKEHKNSKNLPRKILQTTF
ncbi:MAG: Lrp/AsnC family transcriptional regulator [archaeon]|jgi:Lrp/AsnC family transcriptional regulator for asnA, asnC and gidA